MFTIFFNDKSMWKKLIIICHQCKLDSIFIHKEIVPSLIFAYAANQVLEKLIYAKVQTTKCKTNIQKMVVIDQHGSNALNSKMNVVEIISQFIFGQTATIHLLRFGVFISEGLIYINVFVLVSH